MISLDLARRIKLKVRMLADPIKVSGLGGVQSCITAMARVKITLGMNVVYVLNVWLANIGEDLEVLLGMDFMHAAGIRLCVRVGLVRLPDEEMIVMCAGPNHERVGIDVPVHPDEILHLQLGEHAIVRVIYASKSCDVAVMVVNISQSRLWLSTGTVVARIVERDDLFGQEDGNVWSGTSRSTKIPSSLNDRGMNGSWLSSKSPCDHPVYRPQSINGLQICCCVRCQKPPQPERLSPGQFRPVKPGKRSVKTNSDVGTQTCETCDASTQTDTG
ncbi:hypothetical protein PHMEG_00012096 [Phytophthora megakarya]|uniref:Aspartic protease n=1 Tax=Phytophthora megakarya TaxID=4795 RepID=A0A225WA44_9STRA|nr:hypothetical protein PHMEG_00012096 [Phytophthora megakarya]